MCIRFTTQTKKVYKWYHSIRKPLDNLYQDRNKTICVELFYKRRRSKCLLHSDLFVMPVAGLEPARCRHRWILSPLRLPIPSHWRMRRIVLYISFPIKSSPNYNFFAYIFCFSLIYMIQI